MNNIISIRNLTNTKIFTCGTSSALNTYFGSITGRGSYAVLPAILGWWVGTLPHFIPHPGTASAGHTTRSVGHHPAGPASVDCSE